MSPADGPVVRLAAARFLLAVADLRQLPTDRGREVAFAGRSNAGKSSAINALTGRSGLARTSKQPGRTQQLVFFALDGERHLVDLPGYGFARVPEAVRRSWAGLVEGYLSGRRSLAGVVLLTDVRRPLVELDLELLEWCRAARIEVHVTLTKADKLSRAGGLSALQAARDRLEPHASLCSLQLLSATRRQGVDVLRKRVTDWLDGGEQANGQKKAPAPGSGGGKG